MLTSGFHFFFFFFERKRKSPSFQKKVNAAPCEDTKYVCRSVVGTDRVRSCSNDRVHAESSFIGLLGMYHSGLYDLATLKLVEKVTNYFGYSFDLSCTNDIL